MGFWDSVSSGLGSFATGVGSAIGSVVSNPNFQNAAISLGTQYLSNAIQRRSAPPPSPYAAYPTVSYAGGARQFAVQQPQQRYVPTQIQTNRNRQLRLNPGTIAPGTVAGRRIGSVAPLGFSPSLAPAIGAGTGILNQLLPGGFQVPALLGMGELITSPGTTGGGIFSEIGERLTGAVAGRGSMFAYGQTRARALPMLEAVHPETGKVHYWRHMGRPILFTGDMAVCKRVNRVRGKLNRGRPRPR